MKRKGNSKQSEHPFKKPRNQASSYVRFMETNKSSQGKIKAATDDTVDELEDKVSKVRNVRKYQKVIQSKKSNNLEEIDEEDGGASVQQQNFNEEQEEDTILGDINVDDSSRTIKKVSGEEMFQHTESKKWNPEVDEERYKQGSRIYEEGVMYEPFNLASEREEGSFQEDGTYISEKSKKREVLETELYKKKKQKFIQQLSGEGKSARNNRRHNTEENDDDEDDESNLERDSFVDQLEDSEYMNMMASKYQQQQQQQQQQQSKPHPSKPSSKPSLTISQWKQILIDAMESEEETVLDALHRLKQDKHAKAQFEQITNAVVELSNQSEESIYSKTKQELSKELDKTKQTVMWMYKWSNDAAEEFGPYDTYTIKYWLQSGHFQGYNIVVKMIPAATSQEQQQEEEDDMFDSSTTTATTTTTTNNTNLQYIPLEQVDFSLFK